MCVAAPPSDQPSKPYVRPEPSDWAGTVTCRPKPAHDVSVVGPVTATPLTVTRRPAGDVATVTLTFLGLKSCTTVVLSPAESVAVSWICRSLFAAA